MFIHPQSPPYLTPGMSASDAGDNDSIQLNTSTLQALADFYSERDRKAQSLANISGFQLQNNDHDNDEIPLSIKTFDEDWGLSQFWYDEETASTLAAQLLLDCTAESRVGVISTPSVFIALKRQSGDDVNERRAEPHIKLLEFDQRFAMFGKDYQKYDYNEPQDLPADLRHSFDRLIVDPPFHSQECQEKMSDTVRWLAKPGGECRLVVCTGERMEDVVMARYAGLGVRATSFLPTHSGTLQNRYRCYANFECNAWKWRPLDSGTNPKDIQTEYAGT